MELLSYQRIYLKGEDRTNSVKFYSEVNGKIQVVFNSGKSFLYSKKNVRILSSVLSNTKTRNTYSYLAELAKQSGVEVTLESGRKYNILESHFKRIGFIDEKSLLGAYLKAQLPPSSNEPVLESPVFAFGFNPSQKNAVDNALCSRISVIEGPPGTGKTQTILNIIANVTMQGKSVAIVSNNNAATKNVYDKLDQSGLSFMSAFLGSNTNKEQFIKSQKKRACLKHWELSKSDYNTKESELKYKYTRLTQCLEQKIELSSLQQELNSLETEHKYFLKSLTTPLVEKEHKFLKNLDTSEQAINTWFYTEIGARKGALFFFWFSLISIFVPKLKYKRVVYLGLRTYSRQRLVEIFQYQFYNLRISFLKKRCASLRTDLDKFDFDEEMGKYTQLSFELYKNCISKHYNGLSERFFKSEDLVSSSKEFIEHYPIVLSTTYSIKNCLGKDVVYDYLIVDESSQVDICTGALAMSCAKNLVVVGDLMQLPHVVDKEMAIKSDKIRDQYKVEQRLCFKSQSFLSSLIETFPSMKRTLLREHYRCHPKIIEFCNKKFYNDRLIILSEAKTEDDPLIVYRTVLGNHARERVNQRQIDVILNEIIPQENLNLEDGSVGIISPYRRQADKIKSSFDELDVKVDTVDKFQGQERDVVILSTVDNEISKFADNSNRLNVAISRAVKQLIVVVNDTKSLKNTNLGDLVKYIEYHNFAILDSEVNSVFDYLYKSYESKRREFLKNSKKVSQFDSENLMNKLIHEILSEEELHWLGVSTHVPLRMLIKNFSKLNEQEKKYASNYLTHVDFLIYNKVNKAPVLIIEVDGTSFHKENTKQAIRDSMKNSILKKYSIPYIRCRTNESNEKDRIISMLT